MRPPVRNEILLGARFEKSLAGETTLAAMFIARVAMTAVISATATSRRLSRRAPRSIGSQMASWKTMALALVMKTPIAAKTVIVVGRATTWPTTCSRWERPYRVKSGMLSESVAQKPTMAVTLGTKTARNSPVVVNLLGVATMAPRPPFSLARRRIHTSSSVVMTST